MIAADLPREFTLAPPARWPAAAAPYRARRVPADPAPLYLLLLGPGIAWTMVHCGGMCGPIVAGLRFGDQGWAQGGLRFGLFQAGRALALAVEIGRASCRERV